ncbi:MAG: thiamine phosphate synthase [Anaeromyxobacter sp.]|nr:thiamine phosphate synthase [Anaeromyxobacter sp.]MBL0278244.1 thiamine phosphate synthase [Anaeromyxobacter sp.]
MPLPPSAARAARLSRLSGLYAIVGGADPVAQAGAALSGGARVVQLRVKDAPAGQVLEAARRVVALAAGRALVIVNDRADLALLAGADGVHLGDEDLPVAEARALMGPDLLVGRSTRTLADGQAALAAGADHVGFGPVFATASKAIAVAPRGLAALREVAAALPAPLVAIGGIGLEGIAEVAQAGAAAAAVIGALFDGPDPAARARALAAAFEAGRGRR